MNLYFHPDARQDLRDAIDYYNECKTGLGQQFAVQVQKSIHQIQDFPEAWSLISKRTRRVMTNRFPYGFCQGKSPRQPRMSLLITVASGHYYFGGGVTMLVTETKH